MTFATLAVLLMLALALAADAFAVSLCQGAATRPDLRRALAIGGAFGLAQAVMPMLSWALGVVFAAALQSFDHWIVFALLMVLGLKTVREGLANDEPSCTPLSRWALFGAAIATSIDAAAAGVTLPSIGAPVLLACAIIGAVTLLVCAAGAFLGAAGGARLGKRAEVAGGIVLMLIGTKVLVEHLSAAA